MSARRTSRGRSKDVVKHRQRDLARSRPHEGRPSSFRRWSIPASSTPSRARDDTRWPARRSLAANLPDAEGRDPEAVSAWGRRARCGPVGHSRLDGPDVWRPDFGDLPAAAATSCWIGAAVRLWNEGKLSRHIWASLEVILIGFVGVVHHRGAARAGDGHVPHRAGGDRAAHQLHPLSAGHLVRAAVHPVDRHRPRRSG